MSGAEKEWVQEAMSDDMMVVDLLVRLHAAAPPLDWSVRQRRSRPASSSKKQYSQRASPTTPLTWSGATSHSGGSGGGADEDSGRPFAARSKVHGHSLRIVSKRTRKKKTLAELKDDESMFLKERRQLKMQLAAISLSLDNQRATNQSLKRIMIELQHKESIPDHCRRVKWDNGMRSEGRHEPKLSPDAKFVVPDLNMPLEEDCGVS